MKFEGKAALVTGAASGMGAATARYLAAKGARVALLDRQLDAASELASELQGLAFECDVSDADSAQAAIEAAAQAHGPASICVNCAGVAGPPARMVGRDGPMALDTFRSVVEVNLIGSFNVSRLFAAQVDSDSRGDKSETAGVIVMTASVAAYEGQIGQCPYSASKGGVVGLTLPMARELARSGIRVVTIAPGLMNTPMLAGLPENVQQSLAAAVPFPARLGRPEEFAELVGHIVSNDMLNGEVIRLDGAIRLQPS